MHSTRSKIGGHSIGTVVAKLCGAMILPVLLCGCSDSSLSEFVNDLVGDDRDIPADNQESPPAKDSLVQGSPKSAGDPVARKPREIWDILADNLESPPAKDSQGQGSPKSARNRVARDAENIRDIPADTRDAGDIWDAPAYTPKKQSAKGSSKSARNLVARNTGDIQKVPAYTPKKQSAKGSPKSARHRVAKNSGNIHDVPIYALEGLSAKDSLTPGALVRGRTKPGATVHFGGKEVRVSPGGIFAFGVGRNAKGKLTLEIAWRGQSIRRVFSIQRRDYAIVRIPSGAQEGVFKLAENRNSVPYNTVRPSPAEQRRADKEMLELRKVLEQDSNYLSFREKFTWPVTGRISGLFGETRVYTDMRRSIHNGTDVAAPKGTPVTSPVSGRVRLTRDTFFGGRIVVIDHGHGIFSRMAHLSRILVREGEWVQQGATVGEVGATGRATGPHLHWQINWFQLPVDPQLLVPPMPGG